MPDDSSTPVTATNDTQPAQPTVVDNFVNDVQPAVQQAASGAEIAAEVAQKIGESHNVLIALSADPSVDEMAAAIGLSLYLDRLGKRATAIYSGATPNALEFLKPEETFEDSVDTLQDFVIALNKEKADHLRYKLDGEYVKIFITPYRTRIAEDDLEFSYGDFNVDLVLALDVANGVDLDAALREHGRIMHDALIVNITTGNPGKLGEVEWSDKTASSVSEMIAKLLYSANSKIQIEKEEATAFLTGIVAATDRFSNASTTPETMAIASKLMKSGANQQLISKNITAEVENEMFSMPGFGVERKKDNDPSKLEIQHGDEEVVEDTGKEVDATVTEKQSTLLDDLKAAEASLAAAGAETIPDDKKEPVRVEDLEETPVENANDPTANVGAPVEAPASVSEPNTADGIESSSAGFITDKPEKVLQPTEDMTENVGFVQDDDSDKYGKMLEEALGEVNAMSAASNVTSELPAVNGGDNPAVTSAPAVPDSPEINGVPEINYMPMPGDQVLPPPPAPPIDMAAPVLTEPATDNNPVISTMNSAALPPVEPITPAAPIAEPTPEPLGTQPAMQDQVYAPQAADPGAFKIPGM